MNRIERILLQDIYKPKDPRSIGWMFLGYMLVLSDELYIWHQRDSFNLTYTSRDPISVFGWIDWVRE